MAIQFKPNCCFNSLILKEHFKTLYGYNYEFPVDCINLINIYYLRLRDGHQILGCDYDRSSIITKIGLFHMGYNEFIFSNYIKKINIDNVLSVSTSTWTILILATHGLYCFNRNDSNSIEKINIDNVKSMSIGNLDALILNTDGLFRMRGVCLKNIDLIRIDIDNVQSVKSGSYHHLILCNDELYGLGDNKFGQLRTYNAEEIENPIIEDE